MKVRVYKTHTCYGGPFHWNVIMFNGGNEYRMFRFGPLLVKVFK